MKRLNVKMYSEIIPNLYLGNRLSTTIADKLNIDHIISIGSKTKSIGISNTHIGLRDDNSLDITKELNNVTKLMDDLLKKNKKILIHCRAGINRSPSFVLAYMCKYKEMDYDNAMAFILIKRKSCKFSFKENVKKWLEDIKT